MILTPKKRAVVEGETKGYWLTNNSLMNSPYNTFVPHSPQKKAAKVKRLSW